MRRIKGCLVVRLRCRTRDLKRSYFVSHAHPLVCCFVVVILSIICRLMPLIYNIFAGCFTSVGTIMNLVPGWSYDWSGLPGLHCNCWAARPCNLEYRNYSLLNHNINDGTHILYIYKAIAWTVNLITISLGCCKCCVQPLWQQPLSWLSP